MIGIASRVLVFISALVGYSVFGIRQPLPNEVLFNINVPVANLFCRWDAGWYISVALGGYPAGANPVGEQWSWFPLYPMTMKGAGSFLTGFLPPYEADMVAGFFISNILFFLCIILFYKLTEMVLQNSRLAMVSTIFFSFWPGALFYSAAYSESLFMTLALGAFYFLEKGERKKSTLLGFLAGFARSNGFLISIPFLVAALQKRARKQVADAILVASPYLLFNLYGYFSTGLFPVYEIAYSTYAEPQRFLIDQISNSINAGYSALYSVESLLIFFPFCVLILKGFQIKSFSQLSKQESGALKYWTLSFAVLVLILFYSEIFAIHRYAILILPLYWVSAQTWSKNRKTGITLLLIMATILVIGSILFATWNYFL